MAMKKQVNPFFETFAGEYVQIVQDFEITTYINVSEDQSQEVRMPMTCTGFLMDLVDGMVYLSPDGENINQALPFDSVKHVEIVELKDAEQEALDEVPDPKNRSGYN
jgi:hypothetical protein